MSLYTLLLFAHVSGAICLFIGMGVWLFGTAAIARSTRVEQIRTLADLLVMVRLVVPVSALLVIAAGVAMTRIAWGFQTGWIVVALASLGIIGPLGTGLVDPKVRAIARLAHTLPDGALPVALAERAGDNVLHATIHTLVAMLFGIVFLMTTKPTVASAVAAMAICMCVGLISSLPSLIARRTLWTSGIRRHHE